MRIVCDTNILVSGILFKGHPRRILTLVSRGDVTNCTSPALLREAEEVLLRPKFGLRSGVVSGVVALYRDTFEIVHPSRKVGAIVDDPDDNIVLEAADAASADLIVSGDKHLLDLTSWNGIRIVSPGKFAEEMRGRKSL